MARAAYIETIPHAGILQAGGGGAIMGTPSHKKPPKLEEEEKGTRCISGTSVVVPSNPNHIILDEVHRILANSGTKLRDSEKTLPEIDAITKIAIPKKSNGLFYVILVIILILLMKKR